MTNKMAKNYYKSFSNKKSSTPKKSFINRYPTHISNGSLHAWGIELDRKTGSWECSGISGRINRNGAIISLSIPVINADHEYLLKQRFAGRDYRIAIPDIMEWVDMYIDEEKED